jgi:hypothetical protein
LIDYSCCAPSQELPGFEGVQGLVQAISDRPHTTGGAKLGDKLHLSGAWPASLGFELEGECPTIAEQDQVCHTGANP